MGSRVMPNLNFELFYYAFDLILIEFLDRILEKNQFFFNLSGQSKVLPKTIKLCNEFSRNKVITLNVRNFNRLFQKNRVQKLNNTYLETSNKLKHPFSMLELSMLTKKKRNLLNKEAREIHHLVSNNLVKLNSMLHSKIYEQIFFIEQVHDHSLENCKNLISIQKNFLKKRTKKFSVPFNLNILTFLIFLIIILTEVIR